MSLAHLLSRERFAPDRVLVPVAFAVAFALVVSRRPDALFHAQFTAEDGAWWYAQAHDMGGLRAMAVPYRNYLHTVPRLAGWLALVVPLLRAPLVMNVAAISAEAATAAFLCSSRLAAAVPRAWARVLLALLYVGLPNVWGTLSNVTNTQWHLALLACAVAIATPDPRPAWRAFDVAAVAASGLSGPFAIFLLPVVALKWVARREAWSLVLGAVAAVCAAVQVGVMVFAFDDHGGVRPPLGASPVAFLRVVVGRVVYGLFFGQTGYERMFASPGTGWLATWALAVAFVAAAALAAFAAARGSLELRLLLVYAAGALAAAMLWPSKEPITTTFWENLAVPISSNRYFLLPLFALAVTLVWLATRRAVAARAVGVAALAVVALLGVARDWREPAPLDYDFPRFVAKYDRAAPGEKIQILYPPGWTMVLTKP